MPSDVSNLVIASLPHAPDVTKGGGNGLAGLMSGFLSGSKAMGEVQSKEAAHAAGGTTDSMGQKVLNRIGGLAGAFLGAPAVEQAARDPFFEVKQKVAAQNAAMSDLQLQQALKNRDDQIASQGALQEFSNKVQDYIVNGMSNQTGAQADILEYLGRHPYLYNYPPAQQMLQEFGRARTTLQQHELLTNAQSNGARVDYSMNEKSGITTHIRAGAAAGDAMPEARTLTDPVSGKPITVITDGNRWERVPESSLGRQLTVMETKALYAADPSLLVRDPNTGALMADPTRQEAVQRALQVGSGITSATRSKAEEGVTQLTEAINTAQESLTTVQEHPEALGLMGAGRSALEVARGVAGLSNDATITNTRDKLAENFTRIAKTLRVDSGNMTLYERRQLERVGDLTKLDQFEGRAVPMMQNILNAAVGQKLRKLKELNRPIDTQTFQAIQPSEVSGLYDSDLLQNKDLLDLVKAGKLDKSKVRDIIANKPKG